jgi:hypothetical protein
MSQHTQGEWFAEKHVVYALQDCTWLGLPSKENRFEAFVQGKADEAELQANARLIAAAPDLLQAAKKALYCLAHGDETMWEHPESPYHDIWSAIAKATGESS